MVIFYTENNSRYLVEKVNNFRATRARKGEHKGKLYGIIGTLKEDYNFNIIDGVLFLGEAEMDYDVLESLIDKDTKNINVGSRFVARLLDEGNRLNPLGNMRDDMFISTPITKIEPFDHVNSDHED